MLFKGLEKHEFRREIFETKEALSDIVPANQMNCNFCHRHIIESLGAKSGFGVWSTHLLKCKTADEYIEKRDFIKDEIKEYILMLKEESVIKKEVQRKLTNIKIMLFNLDIDAKTTFPVKNIEKNNYFLPHWAIWIRSAKHIPIIVRELTEI